MTGKMMSTISWFLASSSLICSCKSSGMLGLNMLTSTMPQLCWNASVKGRHSNGFSMSYLSWQCYTEMLLRTVFWAALSTMVVKPTLVMLLWSRTIFVTFDDVPLSFCPNM